MRLTRGYLTMRKEYSFFNKNTIWFGIFSLAVSVISRAFFENPIEMIHIVNDMRLLPPMWLYNLISYGWFFLIGVAAGSVIEGCSIGINGGDSAVNACRGGLFFISSLFCSIILYHTFFISQMLFLSLIISFVAMMCSVICAIHWKNVYPGSACVIIFMFSIWRFYLLFVCLSVFLNI